MRAGSEALKKMAERSSRAPEMSSFVRAIIQADELGISLGRILEIQAATRGSSARPLAEEKR